MRLPPKLASLYPEAPRDPLVLVIWQDAMAASPTEQWSAEDTAALEPLLMFDVGFLTENERGLVLSPNISECGAHRRLLFIPRAMVLEVIRLRPAGRHYSKRKT